MPVLRFIWRGVIDLIDFAFCITLFLLIAPFAIYQWVDSILGKES